MNDTIGEAGAPAPLDPFLGNRRQHFLKALRRKFAELVKDLHFGGSQCRFKNGQSLTVIDFDQQIGPKAFGNEKADARHYNVLLRCTYRYDIAPSHRMAPKGARKPYVSCCGLIALTATNNFRKAPEASNTMASIKYTT